MSISNRKTVIDILSLDPSKAAQYSAIENDYIPVDIDKVYIDDNEFSNYGQYQFIYEKSYAKSPSRSLSGSMGSINNLPTFLTPHLILDFSVMSIDDYRKIMQLHYEKNEFVVRCYDPIYNRAVAAKMYFATEEMAKLFAISKNRTTTDGSWEDFLMLVGVREYKVEMIGTNNELDKVTLSYAYNAPLGEDGNPIYPNGVPVTNQYEADVYNGEEVVVGLSSTFSEQPPSPSWRFSHWENESGLRYNDGDVIRIVQDTVLKAIWIPNNKFSIALNYGIAKPVVQENLETGISEPVYEIENVEYGKSIGVLPVPELPYVEDINTEDKFYPYENGAWYRTSVISDKTKVNDGDAYWIARDTTIYYLFTKKVFTVTYHTNSSYSIPQREATYGDPVYLPTLADKPTGETFETFVGWYTSEDFKTKFSKTTMPPKNLDLYAKWKAV